jgi:hypothetical protein
LPLHFRANRYIAHGVILSYLGPPR